MNYSDLTTALGKSMNTLSDSDLRSLNSMLVEEINYRIRQKRAAIRSTINIGDRVIIKDPRCSGKTYIIEKFTAKNAILRENKPNGGINFGVKIRASLNLLQSA
jgi:hypothetical protein